MPSQTEWWWANGFILWWFGQQMQTSPPECVLTRATAQRLNAKWKWACLGHRYTGSQHKYHRHLATVHGLGKISGPKRSLATVGDQHQFEMGHNWKINGRPKLRTCGAVLEWSTFGWKVGGLVPSLPSRVLKTPHLSWWLWVMTIIILWVNENMTEKALMVDK